MFAAPRPRGRQGQWAETRLADASAGDRSLVDLPNVRHPLAVPITRYITTEYWANPQDDRVTIAIDPDTGAVAGYGTWTLADAVPTWKKGDPAPGWQPTRWIRIPRFGVDRRYQGASGDDGIKHADRLYAEVEASFCASGETQPGMFVELFTDRPRWNWQSSRTSEATAG